MFSTSLTKRSPVVTLWLTSFLEQQWVILAGLFLLGFLSRLPFLGQVLYHWDSVNFAFSLHHFDIAAGQPHVPGYILYVLLARIVNVLVQDAQLTLGGISLVSSGLAVTFLYVLGTAMFNRPIGLVAALFLASSPLFWFYGEIALPHSLDALVVIVTIWLLYQIKLGRVSLAIPVAIWLGIAGGLRPQTEVFLMPVVLYAVWRLGWRRSLLAFVVLTVVNLAWFVPLIWLTGGLSQYLEITRNFYLAFNTTTSIVSGGGLWGLSRNLWKLSIYTLYGWGLALLPFLLAAAWLLRSLFAGKSPAYFKDTRFWFFILWIFPTLFYYIFIHMGQQGLVFVFLPALLLLSAAALYNLPSLGKGARYFALAALVILSAVLFVAGPTYPLGIDRFKLLTVDTLRRHDAYYLPRFEAVRNHFPPEHTLLLSAGWRYPQYYLPEYTLLPYALGYRWEADEGQPQVQQTERIDGISAGLQPDRDGFFYVVLFDNDLQAFNQSAQRQEELLLPDGQHLGFMRFTIQEQIELTPHFFEIIPK